MIPSTPNITFNVKCY